MINVLIYDIMPMTPYIPKVIMHIDTKNIERFKYIIDIAEILKHPNQASVHSHRYLEIHAKNIERFKYIIDIGEILKHPNQASVHSHRYLEIHDWLVENVENFIMGFWDNNNCWAAGFNNKEDILAFKLRFKKLDNL